VRRGNNTIESYKETIGGDGLRIRQDLPRLIREGHERMSAADKDLLKWVGVFFRKPTPGKFMMRVRMPNGLAWSRQLRAIADLSRRIGNSVIDITTRQQIQIRGFTLDSVPEIWEKLRGVDLHSLQTGMDNVRNINGCALAGLTPDEAFNASDVVLALDRLLVGRDGNSEFTDLPRKFNIVITGCRTNCTHTESQDVALVPARFCGTLGFNVLVGGKMGSGGFTPAQPLDVFISIDHAAELVAELVRIYRDHGPREARARCRMAFLIEEWGLARLRHELKLRWRFPLLHAGTDLRTTRHSDHLGVTRQKQPGLRAVGLSIPVGRITPDQLDEVARLADVYGAGDVRLTVGQNLVLASVPAQNVPMLLAEPLLRELSPSASPFHRRLVACTGTDFCNLAQIDTKGYAMEVSRGLSGLMTSDREPVSIHWSGCPAGCGNHQAADIGLRGLKTRVGEELIDAVAIYVGGRTGPDTTVGQQVLDVVRCDNNLPRVLAGIIQQLDRFRESGIDVSVDQLAASSPYTPGSDAERPAASAD
jgi:ferredoxin-nitrite reductase